MSERYGDQGLVVLGIHSTRGADKMEAFAKQQGIPFPIAADLGDRSKRAFGVDGNPDYYLIDRSGRMRFADLANREVERAVQALLRESAQEAVHPALAKASANALAKNKRIALLWGDVAEVQALRKVLQQRPDLHLEYEWLHLRREAHPALASTTRGGGPEQPGLTLSALDARGKYLGHLAGSAIVDGSLDPSRKSILAFLDKHRAPSKDAETLWSNALRQATKQNKRVWLTFTSTRTNESGRLERFLQRKGVQGVLQLDYVMVHIDVDRDRHGKALVDRLRAAPGRSLPWMVVTDAKGQVQISSDRNTAEGTIPMGLPESPEEQSWFLKMVDRTRQHMSTEQRAGLVKELSVLGETTR